MTNSGGQTSTLPSGFTVTSNIIPASTILVNANKPGYLLSGGYMQFRVTGSYSQITQGSTLVHNLNVSDVVRLTINSGTQGSLYATSSQISTFSFSDVDLTINGVDYGRNTINYIWISGYDTYTSTLTLNVPSQSAWTDVVPDGTCVICGTVSSAPITVYNLGMGSGGMNLGDMGTIYYTGGTTGYLLS